MTRLYFDCPIKAAYMWKEFNINTYIELTREDGTIFDVVNIDWEGRSIKLDGRKYYVRKESEHIFDPKEGDQGYFSTEAYGEMWHFFEHNSWQSYGYDDSIQDIKIIMRDNKHFFNPLIENND
jgi:hypothetical protein